MPCLRYHYILGDHQTCYLKEFSIFNVVNVFKNTHLDLNGKNTPFLTKNIQIGPGKGHKKNSAPIDFTKVKLVQFSREPNLGQFIHR